MKTSNRNTWSPGRIGTLAVLAFSAVLAIPAAAGERGGGSHSGSHSSGGGGHRSTGPAPSRSSGGHSYSGGRSYSGSRSYSGGTRSWSYGAGVDQKFGARWFMGASYLWRKLDVPEAFCAAPSQFGGCAGQAATFVDSRTSDDDWGSAYVSGALTTWMTATLGYDYYQRDFDTTETTSTGGFQDRVETQRFRPELRFFAPNGIFVRLAGARYDQQVDQRDAFDAAVATLSTVNSEFWVMDAAIGYRFPKRWGSFVIDGRNVFNEKFLFYDRLIQEQVVPARQVTARLEITY